MSETLEALRKREFARWKFATIELMNIGLDHREFRVAVCLLSHMNMKTRLVIPSQRRLATMLGMDESAIGRAIRKLVAVGLLQVERHNRQQTNRYSFSTAKLNEFYDLRADRLANLQLFERAKVSAHDRRDEEETHAPGQEETHAPDREEVSPKLLNGTIKGNHQDSALIEHRHNQDESGTMPREQGDDEESPRGERDGGALRAQYIPPSPALLKTAILSKARDAKVSLDELERRLARERGKTDPGHVRTP